jgi:hypothetical protein
MWEEVERSALLDRSTATGRAAQAKSWAAELDAVERSWADDEAEAGEGESVRARRGQKLKGYFHTPETKDALWEAFSVVAATPAAAAMGFAQRGADWVMPARARMTTEFCDLLWKELTPHLRRAAPDLLKNNFRRQVSDNMRKWFMQADGITLSRAGRWRRCVRGLGLSDVRRERGGGAAACVRMKQENSNLSIPSIHFFVGRRFVSVPPAIFTRFFLRALSPLPACQ